MAITFTRRSFSPFASSIRTRIHGVPAIVALVTASRLCGRVLPVCRVAAAPRGRAARHRADIDRQLPHGSPASGERSNALLAHRDEPSGARSPRRAISRTASDAARGHVAGGGTRRRGGARRPRAASRSSRAHAAADRVSLAHARAAAAGNGAGARWRSRPRRAPSRGPSSASTPGAGSPSTSPYRTTTSSAASARISTRCSVTCSTTLASGEIAGGVSSHLVFRRRPGPGRRDQCGRLTGRGRPSLRDAVLQRGVRADEAAPGSGFGLAIVRELAELYGGSIAWRPRWRVASGPPDPAVRPCITAGQVSQNSLGVRSTTRPWGQVYTRPRGQVYKSPIPGARSSLRSAVSNDAET